MPFGRRMPCRPVRTVLLTGLAWWTLAAGALAGPLFAGCELFPEKAVFNQRIDDVQRFPVHPRSHAWIALIGGPTRLHADWGRSEDVSQPARYAGIPINVVDGTDATTRWPLISYDINDGSGSGVPAESDCAVLEQGRPVIRRGCDGVIPARRRFPFPHDDLVRAENGVCNDPKACGDRHVLVVEKGSCRLWESFFTYQIGGRWLAYSSAAWDLKSLEMRPNGWTSADAAGLPITPLLARVAEADAGVIPHALRVTFRSGVTDRRAVWPARHAAGPTRPDGVPFGALLRLRADFDIPFWWSGQAKALARAMQKYGLYVADIGTDFFVQGEPSEAWSRLSIFGIQRLRLDQFEFVDTRSVTDHPRFNPDSFAVPW